MQITTLQDKTLPIEYKTRQYNTNTKCDTIQFKSIQYNKNTTTESTNYNIIQYNQSYINKKTTKQPYYKIHDNTI